MTTGAEAWVWTAAAARCLMKTCCWLNDASKAGFDACTT